jgi:hypothetical protein
VIENWQRESRSQVEFIERFHRAVLENSGKLIWVEKTPKNGERFHFVRRHFPNAKLVHIIRDGRDVVCSLRRTAFAKLDHSPWESVEAVLRCAVQWRTSVRAGLRLRGDPAYYELRYEDLVRDPVSTLRDLTGFLGVPWDDCVVNPTPKVASGSLAPPCSVDDDESAAAAAPIFQRSVGRWRQDLTHQDCNALRLLISPLLVELGYATELDWRVCALQEDTGIPAGRDAVFSADAL